MMLLHDRAVRELGGIASARATSHSHARWLEVAEGWREVAETCTSTGDFQHAAWAARLARQITHAVANETAIRGVRHQRTVN